MVVVARWSGKALSIPEKRRICDSKTYVATSVTGPSRSFALNGAITWSAPFKIAWCPAIDDRGAGRFLSLSPLLTGQSDRLSDRQLVAA